MNSEATLKKFNGDCGMGYLFGDSYNIALVDFLKNVLVLAVVWFVHHLNIFSDDGISTVIGSLPSSSWRLSLSIVKDVIFVDANACHVQSVD